MQSQAPPLLPRGRQVQAALQPHVGVADQDQEDEHHDGREQLPAPVAQDQRPGIEEGGLEVEDDEIDRHQEEGDRQPLMGQVEQGHARLDGRLLEAPAPLVAHELAEEMRRDEDDGPQRDRDPHRQQDWEVLLRQGTFPPEVGGLQKIPAEDDGAGARLRAREGCHKLGPETSGLFPYYRARAQDSSWPPSQARRKSSRARTGSGMTPSPLAYRLARLAQASTSPPSQARW